MMCLWRALAIALDSLGLSSKAGMVTGSGGASFGERTLQFNSCESFKDTSTGRTMMRLQTGEIPPVLPGKGPAAMPLAAKLALLALACGHLKHTLVNFSNCVIFNVCFGCLNV